MSGIFHGFDPHDTPLNDKCDPVAQALGLLDVMGGKKYGGPGSVKIGNELSQLSGAGHIDTRGGFVQKQELWFVDDSGGNGELALHAFGIAPEFSLRRVCQAKIAQQLLCPAALSCFFNP